MKNFKLKTYHGDNFEIEPGNEKNGRSGEIIMSGLGPWENFSLSEVEKIVSYLETWIISENIKKSVKTKKRKRK